MTQARVLITGGQGQLATALRQRFERAGFSDRVWGPGRTDLDVTQTGSIRDAVRRHRPDWIVNCAAYTAVDAAESDPGAAARVNDTAVGLLADAAAEHRSRILHVSTDYVFSGKPAGVYREDDPVDPINVYGATKRRGEERLLAHPVHSAILRTAWLYGDCGQNFLVRMLPRGREAARDGKPLPVVADQSGTPTDVHTFSLQIEACIEQEAQGLFHAVAAGEATWLEFADEIFRQCGLLVPLTPIRGEDLRRPARRPTRVVLANERLDRLGLSRMLPWRDGLRGVVERLGQGSG